MQVFLKTCRGKTITLNVESSETISSVKAKVERKDGTPSFLYRLAYGGRQLEDGRTLAEYGVQRDSTLFQLLCKQHARWAPISQISIETLMGETSALGKLNARQTVEEIMDMIEELVGVAPEAQRLFFDGQRLEGGHTLGEYKVEDKSVLHLLLRSDVSILHDAVSRGRPQSLRQLLGAAPAWGREQLEGRDASGATPLAAAAGTGQLGCLQELLRAGADRETFDKDGWRPLHLAASHGHALCVGALLRAGAEREARARGRQSALHLAAQAGHMATVAVLLAAGAGMEARSSSGQTPLLAAAGAGEADIVEVLLGAGADLRATTKDGQSALHLAAAGGRAAAASVLVSAGADLAADSRAKDTALHLAAAAGQVRCVELLLGAGAPKDAQNATGATPLHRAASNGQLGSLCTLLVAGADVEAQDNGGSRPLHVACSGHEACVAELLRAGADVEARDRYARCPLHLAAGGGCLPCIQSLLAAGADREAVDSDGWTPTVSAAVHGQVEAMLALGGNLNALDGDGEHCLQLLLRQEGDGQPLLQPGQLRAMLEAGASVALACEAGAPSPLEVLLLLDDSPPQSQTPELVRILVKAGCPVDTGEHTTARRWFNNMRSAALNQQQYPWPAPIHSLSLEISKELLWAAAKERAAGQPSFLFDSLAMGSLELAQLVLGVFPEAPSWREDQSGRCPVEAVVASLASALGSLGAPPQAGWEEAHAGAVLHACRLVQALLGAGCPAAPRLAFAGFPNASLANSMLGNLRMVALPQWAVKPLRSLLSLVAAGPAEWSPQLHAAYPPAFRSAARALLLANESRGFGLARQGVEGDASPARRAQRLCPAPGAGAQALQQAVGTQLPGGVLQHVLRLASQPLEVWVPELRPFLRG